MFTRKTFVSLALVISLQCGIFGFLHRPIAFKHHYIKEAKGPSVASFAKQSFDSIRRRGSGLLSTETPASDDDAIEYYENDDFMKDLRLRIARSQVFGPRIDDGFKPKEVFIILFEKDTDNEGVHSIEFPKGSGSNVVLAFESLEQCEVFSETLENQHFHNPQPTEILLKDLEDYCHPLGVEVQVVPEGTSLTPPPDNVENFDHDPFLNQAKAKFESLLDLPCDPEKNLGSRPIDPFHDDSYGSWE